MSSEASVLMCTVAHEVLAASGVAVKRTVHKNAEVALGRNEFRDILLKFSLGKKDFKFRLQDIQLHKKFAKDGKATIKLINHNAQFMLSNCPPDKLILFLKTLCTKLTILRQTGPTVTNRQRLLSEQPSAFQEISPLNMKDLESVHAMRARAEENKSNLFTPKGKRKSPMGEENRLPMGNKKARTGVVCAVTTAARPVASPEILSREQKRVLEVVLKGRNVYFTGSAGTGKSFLLKRIIGALPPHHTFATASTGVAACHIGGTTLHAFAGIGSGTADLQQCVELASRPQIALQWKRCRHLVIDEISMVDGDLFDKLDTVAKVIKKTDAAFGGIQLILCGDFLQLPPVTEKGTKRKFAFQSKAWQACMEVTMELTEVRRQSNEKFISILQSVRLGRTSAEVCQALTATSKHVIDKDGILATRLCTHKEDVNHINSMHLDRLKGETRAFEASDSDPGLAKNIDAQCPVARRLQLKIGAQVMLAKNLDVQRGLVNGARGVITGFESSPQGHPIVKFICGTTSTLAPERWSFKSAGGLILSRRQLPLKLAWAISIHKSQGMSLDCVEISLARVFESGQAYVALSRARSLEGLRVLDFDKSCVRADPAVIKYYQRIRRQVQDAGTTERPPMPVSHW